jgi:hypothetical protein
MNAMLEPRMVAASTHRAEFAAQGVAEGQERITASSQGCFMQVL